MLSRITLILLLSLVPISAHALGAVVGPECTFTWTHDPATLAVVEGSKVVLGSESTLANPVTVDVGNVTTATCTQAGLTQNGQYYAAVVAYNRAGDSQRSNVVPFVFVATVPGAPTLTVQ